MVDSDDDKSTNRTRAENIFRALAVYIASAWAIVEGTGFLVSNYGLSRSVVDGSIIVAVGGGLITLVLGWYHGPSGVQRVRRAEIVLVAMISVATVASVIFLARGNPIEDFLAQSGQQFVIDYPTPSPDSEEKTLFKLSFKPIPLDRIKHSEDEYIMIAEGNLELEMPGVKMIVEKRPVLAEFLDSGRHRVTVIFSELPYGIESLLSTAETQNRSNIESNIFTLRLDRDFRVEATEERITVTILGRFLHESKYYESENQ